MKGLRVLEIASLIYVALPTVLFLAGWLKPAFSVPLLIFLGAGIYRAWRASLGHGVAADDPPREETGRRTWVRYACIAILVALAVALSGIGGYPSYQFPDYKKHNAFFRDLTENPWPLAYEQTGTDGQPRVLNAYFGYYLPSAFVGKCFGGVVGYHFSYAWAVLGVLLTVAWFLRLTGKVSVTFALVFLLFGGLDILGWTIANGWPAYPDCNGALDYWMPRFISGNARSALMNGVFFMFSSNFTFLMDGPHHILPSWICILMLVHDAIARRSSQRTVLLWSLIPLVSAFVAVGTLPFVLVALWQTRLRKALNLGNLVAAPLVLLVAGLYLHSNNGAYVHGWLWDFQNLRRAWPNLFLYYLVEFGLYAVFCPLLKQKEHRRFHVWWYTAIGVLLLLPWYRIGAANDLTSKGAAAAILVFQVCLVVALRTEWQAPSRRYIGALPFLLFLGTFASIGEMMRALDYGLEVKSFNMKSINPINELEPKSEAAQLFSDGGTFFWRFLARRPHFQPPRPVPVIASWDFAGGKPGPYEWKCLAPNGRISSKECAFDLQLSKSILRLSGVNMASEDFSRIRVKIKGVRKGDPQRKPVYPSKILFYWARSTDITPENRAWPFSIDRAVQLQRGRDSELWEFKLTAHKRWNGVLCDLFLQMNSPEEFTDWCEFQISQIEFLER